MGNKSLTERGDDLLKDGVWGLRDNKLEEVKNLINAGFPIDTFVTSKNINSQYTMRGTLLHYACLYGSYDIAKFLMGKGASTTMKFQDSCYLGYDGSHSYEELNGLTPVELAVKYNHQDIVRLLKPELQTPAINQPVVQTSTTLPTPTPTLLSTPTPTLLSTPTLKSPQPVQATSIVTPVIDPMVQATNNIARLLEAPPSSNLRFSPIYGISDIKVTSLMEAITPLVTNHLVKYIDKYTQDALDLFSEKPLPSVLNLDETVAIHLYTQEWPEHTCSLYYVLNAQLRSKDRSMIKPFFPYIKILLTGLTKLDKTPGITYRGVGLNLSNDYTIGDKIQWWSFTSTTTDGNACQNFLEKSPERTLFRLDQKCGVNIQKFSGFPDESEILLCPMTVLVKNKFVVVKGLWMVELEEIGNPLVNL